MEAVRMSLADAGKVLGIATNSVRSRWKAGHLRGERDNAGKVWVWIDPTSDVRPSKPATKASTEGEVTALREHIATLNDLEPKHSEVVGEMHLVAQQIARERGHAEDGYRTVFNCNAAAGQTVFHVHLHLLGGRDFSWPPG